jgi:MoaA/NifB/PqqE/SkfB family radical SAM enzyme
MPETIVRAVREGLFDKGVASGVSADPRYLKAIEKQSTICPTVPRRIVFELTNDCNLSCRVCGRNSVHFEPRYLPFEHFKLLTAALAPHGLEEVTLMGWGDPTMHPDFKDMLRFAHEQRVRKYFLTNGMKLKELEDVLFETETEVFAVSVDGAKQETNSFLRSGSQLDYINKSLERIMNRRARENLKSPWCNYCVTLMKQNINEFPAIVQMAADVGIDEVKCVYLTAFRPDHLPDILNNETKLINDVFTDAVNIARKNNILLKLPHIPGFDDEAGGNEHKPCFVGWRDFYLGSDGWIRPCMSTAQKFGEFKPRKVKGKLEFDFVDFMELWNSDQYHKFRKTVNKWGDSKMPEQCKRCYQSAHASWNKEYAFNQVGETFAPTWDKENK